MALTLGNLKAVVNHELGGDPATLITNADVTKQHIVNQAGRLLVSMRRWRFLERAQYLLTVTASTTYVDLPTDFAEMIGLKYNGSQQVVELTTPGRIDAVRASGLGAGGRLYAAVVHPSQTIQAAVPGAPRLDLAPTPSETVADALALRYRAGWVELTQDAHVSNLPLWLDALLEQTVRAVARGREDGDLEPRLAAVARGFLFQIAASRDDSIQTEFGVPVNGAAAVQRAAMQSDVPDMTITSVGAPV